MKLLYCLSNLGDYLGGVPRNRAKDLVEKLSRTRIYQDYERAFNETTGLPLTLRPPDSLTAPLHGKKHENPFCSLMAKTNRTCAACLESQQLMMEKADREAATVVCFAGLCDTAVPVRLGDELMGFLQTGQIALKKPTR